MSDTGRRLLWSPAVHRAAGEVCHYFMFSTVDCRGARLKEQLGVLHESLRITGVTAHVIVGPNDLLVRAWLTKPKRQAYIAALMAQRQQLEIDTLHEFAAESVEYSWLTPAEEEIQRQLHQASQQTFLRGDSPSSPRGLLRRVEDEPETALAEMLSLGYVIPINGVVGSKLFMFFNQRVEQPSPRLHDIIKTTAHENGLKNVSVYVGEGFCSFVLKAVVPASDSVSGEYATKTRGTEHDLAVMTAVTSIQDKLFINGLVGWSLLPPLAFMEEKDEEIDGLVEDPIVALISTFTQAREDAVNSDLVRTSMAKFATASLVNSYLSHLEQIREPAPPSVPDLAGRVQRRMISLLGGILAQSRKRVNRELSFLVTLNKDAQHALSLLLQEYGATDDSDVFGTSITRTIAALHKLASADARVADELQSHLDLARMTVQAIDAEEMQEMFLKGDLFSFELNGDLQPATLDALERVRQSAILQIGVESLRESLRSADFS